MNYAKIIFIFLFATIYATSAFSQTVPEGIAFNIEWGSVTITKYTGKATSLVIPNQIQNLPVTEIGERAFSGCSGLTSITIPNSVSNIGERAFSGCSGLTSITIPNSVSNIGMGAFSRCSGLTSITIPNSVSSIENFAFSGCNGLTNITIPASVFYIGDAAFSMCKGLTSIIVEKNNTNYTSNNGILFDKNMRKLMVYPGGKGGTYTIPNSVTEIGVGAFSECSGLTAVTIPSSVTTIEYSAFSGCSGLTNITIPASVTYMFAEVFSACKGLTSIIVEENNDNYASINGILFDKNIRKLIAYPGGKGGVYTIPNSVTYIVYGAFSGCSGLTSITIPNSVTYIGDRAFSGCSGLTNITIPNSVTEIRNQAFSGCNGLTNVSLSRKTILGYEVFPSTAKLTYRD